ncbi:MAG: site-2 protease family protein [Candidatus Cloacimonetes bacterium]|nr:site-2 protease family protein [Candidatus Cloacimonadota bacterium]
MSYIYLFLIQLPILLFTLTIHEFSHGLVAYKLGDDTAKRAGRLTLNPISHIDPIGLIMLFLVRIGWAKPVPINPYNFRNYKRDTALSAAAGPASNFILAIILAIGYRLVTAGSGFNGMQRFFLTLQYSEFSGIGDFLNFIVMFTIFINLALGLFNLIPIPPMDGSKILGGFLSDEAYYKYTARERQGAQILLIIFVLSFVFHLNLIGRLIFPPLLFLMKILVG